MGGVAANTVGINHFIAYVFLPIGKIAFDTFLAISTWFLVDSVFKPEKFIRIWFQVLFYNIVFTVITIIIGYDHSVGWRQLIGSLFPILGNSHGFASTYLLFLLTVPILKMLIEKFNLATIKFLTVLGFLIQVFSAPVGVIIGYSQPYRSELLLFVLCYFIAYLMKNSNISNVHTLKARLACVAIILLCYIAYFIPYYPADESSVFNICAGFAVFLLFKGIEIKQSKMINFVATTTFGILLFHDHNVFRVTFWHYIWKDEFDYYGVMRFTGCYLITAVIIFIIGMIIDCVRKKLFEAGTMKTLFIKKAVLKLSDLYH